MAISNFNGKMRDELLDGEIFCTLEEAKILMARWREGYQATQCFRLSSP